MGRQSEIRPRILVLTSTYPRWPDDTLPPFVHELSRRLVDRFDVHVLAPHARRAAVSENIDGVEIHRFRYMPARFETLAYEGGMLPGLRRRPWRLLALPIFLIAQLVASVRLLRNHHFDVIHAHWLLPQGLIAVIAKRLSGKRSRILCTCHGTDIYALNDVLARRLKRYTLSKSDKVTVVSRAMLAAIERFTDVDSRFSVLPMGVDTQTRFIPAAKPNKSKDILFVGRLTQQKGVSCLLEAFALSANKSRLKLRVIGTGPEQKQLHAQATRLNLDDIVEFLGPIPNKDMPHWYQRSAILVFPSITTRGGDQEGFGLVPAEAMACGCAVLASDFPGIRDVIQHRITGMLVQPGNPAELAAALDMLLSDTRMREQLASSGREFVIEHFDWRHIAGKYADLIMQLSIS